MPETFRRILHSRGTPDKGAWRKIMGDFVLSIDQGTTGTTALVFDRDCRVRGRGYSEFTQHYPRPGWVEHDAEEIWRVSLGAAREALEGAGVEARELRAVGVTNQRETVVAWERASGSPVGRAIVWQDRRTASICAELKARGLEETVRAKTGLMLDPYFSGTKLKWLLDNTPSLRSRAARGGVVFGTIDSWLVWKLTGGRAHATDPSNASRTLLFDIRKLRWDDELLALFGVPREALPEVKPRSEEHTSELQSRQSLVCRLLLEKKKAQTVNAGHRTVPRSPNHYNPAYMCGPLAEE